MLSETVDDHGAL